MGFSYVRLGAYWNQIELKPGQYDFSKLDRQIAQAAKDKVKVVLTVGMKAPRWPEFFIPDWVLEKTSFSFGQDVSQNSFLRSRVLKFIETIVNRYKDNPAIAVWQVENEPSTRIGPGRWWIGKDFVADEVWLVRALDPRQRPILLTVAVYPNKFLYFSQILFSSNDRVRVSLALCDILGINVYPTIGQNFLGFDLQIRSTKDERARYFKPILELAKKKNKKVWATEVQAEPWEPGQLVHKGPEDPKTISVEDIKGYCNELTALGIDTIFLWGGEYWIYRKDEHKDKTWYNAVMDILH